MRLSAPLYLFDQKDSSLKVVPLGSDWYFIPDGVMFIVSVQGSHGA